MPDKDGRCAFLALTQGVWMRQVFKTTHWRDMSHFSHLAWSDKYLDYHTTDPEPVIITSEDTKTDY